MKPRSCLQLSCLGAQLLSALLAVAVSLLGCDSEAPPDGFATAGSGSTHEVAVLSQALVDCESELDCFNAGAPLWCHPVRRECVLCYSDAHCWGWDEVCRSDNPCGQPEP